MLTCIDLSTRYDFRSMYILYKLNRGTIKNTHFLRMTNISYDMLKTIKYIKNIHNKYLYIYSI